MPQPGTTGTEKTFGKEALRFGVLEGNLNSAATATAGAATLNQGQGVVTSETITTAAAATYTLTLTNSLVATTDLVFATVWNGSNTAGTPTVATCTPGVGVVTIVVQNINGATAFSGNLKIGFLVIKKQAAQL